MTGWKAHIDLTSPLWADYQDLLDRLPEDSFPDAAALNRILPRATRSGSGMHIRFAPASQLGEVPYERHIFETGEVSTREDNWHDLFNALVWCRLPRLKAAMNARHYAHLEQEKNGRRGGVRDALTLFDESGVIVIGSNRALLDSLASRDWQGAFVSHRGAWADETRPLVCGHAILEKFLNPYKAITAHALLLHAPAPQAVSAIDEYLAAALEKDRLPGSTADLSPLPLMGIPAWWPAAVQDPDFYRDGHVFRAPRKPFAPVAIHRFGAKSDQG